MLINVAVIGPGDLVDMIVNTATPFDSLNMLPFVYKHEQETASLVKQCKEVADVLLFSGPIPYQIARDHVDDHSTMIYLPYNGASFYRAFFQFWKEKICRYESKPIRFSIDVLKKEEIEDRLEELEVAIDKMFVQEYHIGQKTEEIVQFHYQLWINQEVDAVFTCVNSAYKKLIDLGVPCYRMIPTKSSILDCLHSVQLVGKSVQLNDTQLAIGIINVDNFSEKRGLSEYEMQRKKLALQQVLIDYGEEIQALMNWSDRDEITFVTTRGVIERTTQNFTRYQLLELIVNQLKLNANIGIGLGRTANETEGKAREAVLKAKSCGGGSCFIIMQDGEVKGPLGKEYQLDYSIRSDDPYRLDIARQAGLSIGTINKLVSYCKNYGNSKVTAAELAVGFGITIRSARRILRKLEDSDLAVVIGEEQPVRKGRPRQLYNLKMLW